MWFLAIYHLTQSKGGMSSIELARRHYFRAIELGGAPDASLEKTLATPVVTPTPSPTPAP